MIFHRVLLILTLLAALPTPALYGAGGQAAEQHEEAHAGGEHHALPPNAVVLTEIGPFAITNSMVVTWIVAIGLILVAQLATRKSPARCISRRAKRTRSAITETAQQCIGTWS